jgi:hypothetical protein
MPKTRKTPASRKQSNNRARKPKLQPLDSDLIEAVSYDESAATLTAKLRTTGETYIYEEVPSQVYKELLAAESKGRFFEKWVAGKSYPSHKAS